jgi:hypothetical protein
MRPQIRLQVHPLRLPGVCVPADLGSQMHPFVDSDPAALNKLMCCRQLQQAGQT